MLLCLLVLVGGTNLVLLVPDLWFSFFLALWPCVRLPETACEWKVVLPPFPKPRNPRLHLRLHQHQHQHRHRHRRLPSRLPNRPHTASSARLALLKMSSDCGATWPCVSAACPAPVALVRLTALGFLDFFFFVLVVLVCSRIAWETRGSTSPTRLPKLRWRATSRDVACFSTWQAPCLVGMEPEPQSTNPSSSGLWKRMSVWWLPAGTNRRVCECSWVLCVCMCVCVCVCV